ncbi:hypothetical protein, partial [Streptomyces sp. NPDC003832]
DLRNQEPVTRAGAQPGDLAQPERSEAFRQWLSDAVQEQADQLTDDQVPPSAPSATVPLSLLRSAGHQLTDAQSMEGALLGDRLPVAGLDLGPAVRLRLLLADPTLAGPGTELPLIPLLAAAVGALGVAVAVAETDGPVSVIGPTAESGPEYRRHALDLLLLLLRDGDRWLVGHPRPDVRPVPAGPVPGDSDVRPTPAAPLPRNP